GSRRPPRPFLQVGSPARRCPPAVDGGRSRAGRVRTAALREVAPNARQLANAPLPLARAVFSKTARAFFGLNLGVAGSRASQCSSGGGRESPLIVTPWSEDSPKTVAGTA